jgi:hypothetical protein
MVTCSIGWIRGVNGIGGTVSKVSSCHGAKTGAAGGEEGGVTVSDRASEADGGEKSAVEKR